MRCDFALMEQHLEAPRGPLANARLVLSRLQPGRSMIGAPAPSLKLVLEGEERYEVDGRAVTVRPGEFLYLDAGATCTGTNRATTTGMCLILPAEPGAGRSAQGNDPVLGRALVLSSATSAMGRALRDFGERIARNPAIGPQLAGELAMRVQQAIAEPLAQSRAAIEGLGAARQTTRRQLFRRLERARGYLYEHDDRCVSLGELAVIAGLSQFHLARYFKLAFGLAPIAYHRALRLDRAARFIAAGEGSLAKAAEITGYSDGVALSHAFRKHFGHAPRQWAMRKRS